MKTSDILSEKDLNILHDDKFIGGLKEYMLKENIQTIMINDYMLDAKSLSFRKSEPLEIVSELDNCLLLYHFFIKYQYYNLAAAIRNNMYCRIPKGK